MTGQKIDRRLCVAPMMSHTDRHFRRLLRLISRRVMLYTEMIPCGALLHGDSAARLRFDPAEHPLGIQLGGSVPAELRCCARMAEDAGFDEVNLNVGCPSVRVRSGRFGACLMAEPARVADCIAAMQSTVSIPVTVKTRVGIDDHDDYRFLADFVATVAAAACRTFVIHARKAWLAGMNPRQNRCVPPLRHEFVHRLKRDFPALEIVLNGGIDDLDCASRHLRWVDGVMIGRAICSNPYLLAAADRCIFGGVHSWPSRETVFRSYLVYARRQLALGVGLPRLMRPASGMFFGQPGGRAFRRHLSQNGGRPYRDTRVFEEALRFVRAA